MMNVVVSSSSSSSSSSVSASVSGILSSQASSTTCSNNRRRIILVLMLLLVVTISLVRGVDLQKHFSACIGKTSSFASSSFVGHKLDTIISASPSILIDGRTTLYTYEDNDDLQDHTDCALTVALIDPRFPYFQENDTMFTKTLESIANYVPKTACIVLQTSICLWQTYSHHSSGATGESQFLYYRGDVRSVSNSDHNQHGYYYGKCGTRIFPNHTVANGNNEAAILTLAAQSMYSRSGPLLQEFWNRGRVRVSILNHSLYNLKSCHEFQSINDVFLSTHYWMKEFLAPQDADLVLVMQRDTVLCKQLHLEPWRHFAYVGSPWFLQFPYLKDQYTRGKYIRIRDKSDADYSKVAWQEYWERIDPYYTGYYDDDSKNAGNRSSNCSTMKAQVNNIRCPLPQGMPAFPKSLPTRARWVGNGGLTLRSRTAMLRMLRICPKRIKENGDDSAPCQVDAMQEDIFFSVMLAIVGGGTIPDAEQASFFSMDQDFGWPISAAAEGGQISISQGGVNATIPTRMSTSDLLNWLGLTAWEQLQKEERNLGHYLPIGQHKCFHSFKSGGYACVPNKEYCKYSFNDDNRPVNMLFENGW